MSEPLTDDEWESVSEIWAEHTNENILSGFGAHACPCETCGVYRRETAKSLTEYRERQRENLNRPEVNDGIPF